MQSEISPASSPTLRQDCNPGCQDPLQPPMLQTLENLAFPAICISNIWLTKQLISPFRNLTRARNCWRNVVDPVRSELLTPTSRPGRMFGIPISSHSCTKILAVVRRVVKTMHFFSFDWPKWWVKMAKRRSTLELSWPDSKGCWKECSFTVW